MTTRMIILASLLLAGCGAAPKPCVATPEPRNQDSGQSASPTPSTPSPEVAAESTVARWRQHDIHRPKPPVVEPGDDVIASKPPKHAIVLFDGSSLDAWKSPDGGPARWKVTGGGVEPIPGAGPIETRRTFGDVQLHVEWSTPNPPGGTGQDRGNSGVFLMGEFEVQVLDSYKSDTYADGQAGAIYGQYPPLFNASRAPGQWQTYDIAFRRARFDTAGKLLEPARMTVFQNGVLIQNNEEPFGPTAWLKWLPYSSEQGEHGAIRLQDHGQPVRYRNIWVSELPERPAPAASDLARPTVVSLPTQTLDRYVGHYLLGAKADGPKATIEREGDHLTLAFPFRPQPLVLEPISDREFSLPDTDARLTFLDDAHGHVLGVRLRVGDGEDSWKRGEP